MIISLIVIGLIGNNYILEKSFTSTQLSQNNMTIKVIAYVGEHNYYKVRAYKNVNGKNVAYLEGEINAQTGAQVKAEINTLLDKGSAVVLSFKSVVYMNSSGLREIIDLFKTASKNKKEVSLCDMNSDIREMFSFTGLDKVFKIYDTESAAIG